MTKTLAAFALIGIFALLSYGQGKRNATKELRDTLRKGASDTEDVTIVVPYDGKDIYRFRVNRKTLEKNPIL